MYCTGVVAVGVEASLGGEHWGFCVAGTGTGSGVTDGCGSWAGRMVAASVCQLVKVR